jgi:hypothetical protein
MYLNFDLVRNSLLKNEELILDKNGFADSLGGI